MQVRKEWRCENQLKKRLKVKSSNFPLFNDREEKEPEMVIKLLNRKEIKEKALQETVMFIVLFYHRQPQASMSLQLSLSYKCHRKFYV